MRDQEASFAGAAGSHFRATDKTLSERLLRLPFDYKVAVLPTSRHRIRRYDVVRDYTDVLVPELSKDDMRVAIEYGEYETLYPEEVPAVAPIYAWDGRLYRPALSRDGLEHLDIAALEDAVSTRWSQFIQIADVPLSPFHPCGFPSQGVRWGLPSSNPLGHWPFERVAGERKWGPKLRVIASTREKQLASAQSYLATGVVSVGGMAYVECAEPAWAVDASGEGGREGVRIRLEPRPSLARAFDHFRLDRLDEAREWARRRGGSDSGPAEVNVLLDDALQRDDEWLLACHMVEWLPFLAGPPPQNDEEDPRDRAGALATVFRNEGRLPSPSEAEDLLEALLMSMDACDGEGVTGNARTNAVLGRIRERWLAAKEMGRGADIRHLLDAADMAAMEDMINES